MQKSLGISHRAHQARNEPFKSCLCLGRMHNTTTFTVCRGHCLRHSAVRVGHLHNAWSQQEVRIVAAKVELNVVCAPQATSTCFFAERLGRLRLASQQPLTLPPVACMR